MGNLKENIETLLQIAIEEKDFDLANAVADLMLTIQGTYNAPSNWHTEITELANLYNDDDWLRETDVLKYLIEE